MSNKSRGHEKGELKLSDKAQNKPFKRATLDAAYLSKPAHLQTRKERYEAGRALRVKYPRESHAEYEVNSSGRSDPIEIMIESNEGRIEGLLPIRYERMLSSPFGFFRGAAAIMASDLASTPSSGYAVQACGDCHLLNFGAFATPERNIVFDINDFDETFPAPWEWDLKRLAASFVIASRNNGHKKSDGIAAAVKVVESYRDRLRELSEMNTLEAWYSFLDYRSLIELTEDQELKKRRRKVLNKAIDRNSAAEFVKLAHMKDGKPRIKDNPPLIYHDQNSESAEFKKKMEINRELYRASLPPDVRVLFDRYEFVDSALKVVGIGSVGTVCAIALFFAAENDPLFLQIKEARQSVLEPYSNFRSTLSNGARVLIGQRIMQAASDIFLGHYVGASGKHFYVRQLRDVKVRPMVEIFTPANMLGFARNCGWALARAHARSGDPAIISGYIGKGKVFAEAIGQFAATYQKQNESDYQRLVAAIREGRIETSNT
ncbi:MAG: DUF2252 domain-containing protein [Candidatus Obscuribacterales bacterium]|nr:DUF2252 domain-containing protein [Candidatus Obscuribacterales bacterium]